MDQFTLSPASRRFFIYHLLLLLLLFGIIWFLSSFIALFECCKRCGIYGVAYVLQLYARTHTLILQSNQSRCHRKVGYLYIAYNVIPLNRGDKSFLCVHFYLVSKTANLIESTTLTTLPLRTKTSTATIQERVQCAQTFITTLNLRSSLFLTLFLECTHILSLSTFLCYFILFTIFCFVSLKVLRRLFNVSPPYFFDVNESMSHAELFTKYDGLNCCSKIRIEWRERVVSI